MTTANLGKNHPEELWEGYSPDPDPTGPFIDVPALQRRLTALTKQYGGLRVHTASFRCPWPCTQRQYEQVRKAAGDKWIRVMEKKGWQLRSKVHLSHPRQAYGRAGGDWFNFALLDQREFSMVAAFSTEPKPKRIELNLEVIKT